MKKFALYWVVGLFLLQSLSADTVQPKVTPALSPHPVNPLIHNAGPGLTQEDWQRLNAARAAAIKANPDLTTKTQQLALKFRAYQEKLKAVMIEEDPKIAAMIAQLDHGRSASSAPPQSFNSSRPFSSQITFHPQTSPVPAPR